MKLESIKEFTGANKLVLPISKYALKEKYMEFYDRIDKVYWSGQGILSPEDLKKAQDIQTLLMDSIMFFNYQFATTNDVGKDVKYLRRERIRRDKLIKEGKM